MGTDRQIRDEAHRRDAALDLGRNRVHLGTTDQTGFRLVLLDPPRDGLVLRWRNERGCDRLTDRIMVLSEANVSTASALVSQVAHTLAPMLHGRRVDRVAIPTAMGPRSREAVRHGLSTIASPDLCVVDRVVADFAGWLATRRQLRGHIPHGLVMCLDNDGGEISGLVVDTARRHLLAVAPLSIGPGDDVRLTVDRIRSFALETLGASSWPEVSAGFEMIVTSGSGAAHPLFATMIDGLFPATPRSNAVIETTPQEGTIHGLGRLDSLHDYTCAWPTTPIRSGDQIVRPAGPHRPSDDQALVLGKTSALDLEASAFGQPVRSIEVPPSLGSFPRLRLLRNGQLELSGETDRPYTIETTWPARPPTMPSGVLPQPVDDVEPQFGGHS